MSKSKLAKCGLCGKREVAKDMVDGYLTKLKPSLVCEPCDADFVKRSEDFGKGFERTIVSAINVNELSARAQRSMEFAKQEFTVINGLKVTGPSAARKARKQLIENLSYCSCGHKAEKHLDDKQGNLLNCFFVNCKCTRFHYAALQVRSNDLITAGDSGVLTETRDRLGKLRSMTMSNGASKEEYETALGRIAAILMKREAA